MSDLNNRLNFNFFNQYTPNVAQNLLGKILVRKLGDNILAGIITETESYTGKDDPASHAYGKKTERNSPMFGPSGFSYVYFVYGNHFCFNITAKDKNQDAGAVLIRSLHPIVGLDIMQKNRSKNGKKVLSKNLMSGPGKLTQALDITKEYTNLDLTKSSEIFVVDNKIEDLKIATTSRIGIKKAQYKLWRYLIKV